MKELHVSPELKNRKINQHIAGHPVYHIMTLLIDSIEPTLNTKNDTFLFLIIITISTIIF